MLKQRARDNLSAVAFCNMVGGQDELVFDGHSVVIDHEGRVIARAPQFAESLTLCTVDLQAAATARLRDTRLRPPVRHVLPDVRHAGTIERRPHEPGALGGELAAAARAGGRGLCGPLPRRPRLRREERLPARRARPLRRHRLDARRRSSPSTRSGADRVTCVVMPSRYSSEGTQSDARALAASLGVQCLDIPIEPAMDVYERMLAPVFEGREPDITEENLQARIRGNLLMALSNKFGWLVLTTGNKSENAVGYSTLYGDSAGGFAVIKDVPKTLVYRLVDVRNARDAEHPVPRSIVDRPPSAELRPEQVDTDSLPDYDTLDAILQAYIEEDAGREQLTLAGLPEAAVERVFALVDRNEYKRRQAPPGIKITPRAFGRDRRMPITNAYRGRLSAAVSGRRRAHGDRHPDERAEAPVVVAHLHLPHPRGAAAVAAAGDRVDRARGGTGGGSSSGSRGPARSCPRPGRRSRSRSSPSTRPSRRARRRAGARPAGGARRASRHAP